MQLCDSVCALHGLNKAGTQYMKDVFCLFEKKYGTKYGFLLELIQHCLGKDKKEQCILIRIMLIKYLFILQTELPGSACQCYLKYRMKIRNVHHCYTVLYKKAKKQKKIVPFWALCGF